MKLTIGEKYILKVNPGGTYIYKGVFNGYHLFRSKYFRSGLVLLDKGDKASDYFKVI